MIQSLYLENFRGVKSGELDFQPLTILLGSNNSAKTTILEALFLAPNPVRQTPYCLHSRDTRPSDALYVVHSMHKTLDSEGYTILFYNYMADIAKINVSFNGDINKLTFFQKENDISIRSNKSENPGMFRINNEEIRMFAQIRKTSSEIEMSWGRELFMPNSLFISQNLINGAYRFFENNWGSIMNLGIGKQVAKAASEFSNDKYSDITLEPFLGKKNSINAYYTNGNRVRLGDLGEGMQTYFVTRMLYEYEKPELLLWDDIEAHLNPRILLSIANWFGELIENNKQIIVSTHSLEVANIFSGIFDTSLIYLLNLKDGLLTYKKMTSNEFQNLTNEGIDIRMSEGFLI